MDNIPCIQARERLVLFSASVYHTLTSQGIDLNSSEKALIALKKISMNQDLYSSLETIQSHFFQDSLWLTILDAETLTVGEHLIQLWFFKFNEGNDTANILNQLMSPRTRLKNSHHCMFFSICSWGYARCDLQIDIQRHQL